MSSLQSGNTQGATHDDERKMEGSNQGFKLPPEKQAGSGFNAYVAREEDSIYSIQKDSGLGREYETILDKKDQVDFVVKHGQKGTISTQSK